MALDWSKLSFNYTKTNTIICSHFKDGEWSSLESSTSDQITINALSGALHYGLEAFEGLKAYRGADGKVRLFRPEENARRLRRSGAYIGLEAPSDTMFIEACCRVVKENIEYLPPYESGATMYIRPFIIGVGGQIGVHLSGESMFIVAAMPIGSYFGKGFEPSRAVLASEHDRAAPMGTGSYKLGGNYAGTVLAGEIAKRQGYSTVLYPDSAERRYVDEFSSANFFGIKGDTYITPESPSILPSITNKSLLELAPTLGLKTERRELLIEELSGFDEMGAVGTAVVISPIGRVDVKPGWEREGGCEAEIIKSYFAGESLAAGAVSLKLYNALTGIQNGTEKDIFNWCLTI